MLFNSFEFIFVYLPITFLGYFLLAGLTTKPSIRLSWLAIASLAFYSYWNYRFLPVILVSIIANYAFGWFISSAPIGSTVRKTIFTTAIIFNLAALGFYKYANFGIRVFDTTFHAHCHTLSIALPLGISFFTFTQIAYLADVLNGFTIEKNLIKYSLFVSYFPHLIAGPILHHSEMMPQFGSAGSYRLSGERTAIGLTVFIIGLFKKVILADGFSVIANPVFNAALTTNVCIADAWGAALSYALQIYFDFSGYSDMAIGLSYLFGIVLPFNFDSPYKSRSIIEFWKRWHITLSRFLRDYLYIPLGGNRCGIARHNINLFVTMLIGGLWHGAGWTFIIWGGLHGLFLLVNHAWAAFKNRIPFITVLEKSVPYTTLCLFLTQLCVVVAWIYFRANSLPAAHHILLAMANFHSKNAAIFQHTVTNLNFAIIGLGYLACFCLPNTNTVFQRWNIGIDTYKIQRPWSLFSLSWSPSIGWAIASACLLIASLGGIVGNDKSQFLYFQF